MRASEGAYLCSLIFLLLPRLLPVISIKILQLGHNNFVEHCICRLNSQLVRETSLTFSRRVTRRLCNMLGLNMLSTLMRTLFVLTMVNLLVNCNSSVFRLRQDTVLLNFFCKLLFRIFSYL